MKTLMTILFVTFVGLMLSGCAAHHTEPQATSKHFLDYSPAVSAVISPKNSVTISRSRAYQDGAEFVVTGRVKRMHKVQLPGHIDLAICTPDGALLVQETARVPSLASNRKGVLELPFSFRMQTIPPEGSKVRLQYHATSSRDEELSCLDS